MLPKDRRKRKVRHEVGHTSMAIRSRMLGHKGVRLIDDHTGDLGCTSISWEIEGFKSAQRIRERAAVAMAGIAAEPLQLRPEIANRKWFEIACSEEDLRLDIEKTRCLHWISLDPLRIWNEHIEPFLQQNPNATEDEILRHLSALPEYGDGPAYDVVEEYFTLAKQGLQTVPCARFVERLTNRLLSGTSELSSRDCLQMWAECVPESSK